MAKLTNEFVQFTGHLQSLASEITRRLEKSGINLAEAISRVVQPEGEQALDKITAVLAELVRAAKNIFRLTKIGDGRTTEELVRDGNYNYANSNITSANFPVRPKRGVREIVLLEFDHDPTSEEVLAEAVKQDLERPTYEDALYFGVEHPDVQRGRPVVFFHEPWRDSFGNLNVLSLLSIVVLRRLHLSGFDNEWSHCRFAFVRKSK